ncbi:MAG TPA: helix-turn-helix domain-containing protein [Saprospiraceae bacterium]|nr:helix-turn-helix domain-containing protein [Saprospiraceae bacterium]
MPVSVSVNVNHSIYLKDPLETDLGRRILSQAVVLFDEAGLNAFNFKELAARISSTEASIYRYFENKHMLLLYLTCWYWEYLFYLLEMNLRNISDPEEKLNIAVKTVVSGLLDTNENHFLDHEKLQHLMVDLSINAYHSKNIEEENRAGIYDNYMALSAYLSGIIKEVNPEFKYPRSLATTILEMATNHLYFAKHFPEMTELGHAANKFRQLEQMIIYFCRKLLK